MTEKLYLTDGYLFEADAVISEFGEDTRGKYAVLNKTIFYPQGGGQKADVGTICNAEIEIKIHDVRQTNEEIRHYFSEDLNSEFLIGLPVKCFVNKENRSLNSRYHTAGHLLGNAVEKLYPNLKAQKCHAFPGESYAEFDGEVIPNADFITEEINQAIESDLKVYAFDIEKEKFEQLYYKLSYALPNDKKFRAVQIGDYRPIPCGGTHILFLKELGHIYLNKIKSKKGKVKISFEVK